MAKNRNKIKGCTSDKIFDVVNTTILALILIVIAYPLIIAVSSSFSSGKALSQGKVLLFPVEPHLGGYAVVVKNKQVVTGLFNSVFYTVAGTAINMFVSILAAYLCFIVKLGPLPVVIAISLWIKNQKYLAKNSFEEYNRGKTIKR